MIALSIRQPWSWCITSGHKDVENREWRATVRGPLLIHSGLAYYENLDKEPGGQEWLAKSIFDTTGVRVPSASALPRGGIVGVAVLSDCVTVSDSPWFAKGSYGLVLKNAHPLPFVPNAELKAAGVTCFQGIFTVPDDLRIVRAARIALDPDLTPCRWCGGLGCKQCCECGYQEPARKADGGVL